MTTILVQISEPGWTMQALHLACALARNQAASVALLRLMPVRHLSYLGTPFGDKPLTPQEHIAIHEYMATAEDYGVTAMLYAVQCAVTLEALLETAERLDASAVFAQVGPSWLPGWRRWVLWNTKRRFAAAQRHLFTLDDSDAQYPQRVPAISLDLVPALKKD